MQQLCNNIGPGHVGGGSGDTARTAGFTCGPYAARVSDSQLRPGLTGRASCVVGAADTAQALGSGDLPVLGTPRVLALAEEATVRAVAGALPEGGTTVGSRVDLVHSAPSPVGAEVTARAELVDVDGRLLRFEVAVTSGAGTLVATAGVTRVVVDRDRFLQRVQASSPSR